MNKMNAAREFIKLKLIYPIINKKIFRAGIIIFVRINELYLFKSI